MDKPLCWPDYRRKQRLRFPLNDRLEYRPNKYIERAYIDYCVKHNKVISGIYDICFYDTLVEVFSADVRNKHQAPLFKLCQESRDIWQGHTIVTLGESKDG